MDSDVVFGVALGIFMGLAGFAVGVSVESSERKDVQAQAIKRGYAEYKISQQSGRIIFEWKSDK